MLLERGKRGATRVVSRLIVFAKNEKASLSAEEQRAFIEAGRTVTSSYTTLGAWWGVQVNGSRAAPRNLATLTRDCFPSVVGVDLELPSLGSMREPPDFP